MAAFLAGCAGYSVRDVDLERLERGELSPSEVVFTCHGILFDLGLPWDFWLRDEIAAGPQGRLTIVVTYLSEATGVWFGWGSKAPGRLLAQLADGMEDLHRSTGCRAPLRLRGLGFSAGSSAVLEAAARLKSARFHRLVLLNSASFAFSHHPRLLIESGKVGRIVCGWSPFDVVTLFAPLGAGQFGIRPSGGGIENHCLYNLHFPPLLGKGRCRARELLLEEEPSSEPLAQGQKAAHTCGGDAGYRRRVAELLRHGRARKR